MEKTADYCEIENLSPAKYNLAIGVFVMYGLLANAVECYALRSIRIRMDTLSFFLIYMALVLLGSHLINGANDWKISFVGYNLLVLPVGVIVSSVVSRSTLNDVIYVMGLTAAITALMCLAGTKFSEFFIGLGRILLTSLACFIIVELIAVLVFGAHNPAFDAVAIFIFSMYIGYDWSVALKLPKNTNNALLISARLYLDIINIFLRLMNKFKKN